MAVSRIGINVHRISFALIVANTIRDNGSFGITLVENASARVGFKETTDAAPQPNVIEAGMGVFVARSSNAFIAGDTISGDGRDALHLAKNGQTEVTANVLDGNAGNRVSVRQNSGVHLGSRQHLVGWTYEHVRHREQSVWRPMPMRLGALHQFVRRQHVPIHLRGAAAERGGQTGRLLRRHRSKMREGAESHRHDRVDLARQRQSGGGKTMHPMMMMWIGRGAGALGLVLTAAAVLTRLAGSFQLGNFQVTAVLQAGTAAMVLACLGYLVAIAERPN